MTGPRDLLIPTRVPLIPGALDCVTFFSAWGEMGLVLAVLLYVSPTWTSVGLPMELGGRGTLPAGFD